MFEDENDELEEHAQSLEEALKYTSTMIRWLYFDYMLFMEGATFERFKKFYLEDIFPGWMDKINDKYADHVEGRLNERE